MNTTKYETVAKTCTEKSEYFQWLGFANIATTFAEAAQAINEMAELLHKVAEEVAEEGANE